MAWFLLSIFLISPALAAYPPVMVEVIPQEQPVTATAAYAYVVRVVSGDLVAVQTKGGAVNVKIWGIVAPEGHWAKRAKDYLSWRVERKDCAVEVMGRDRYGRVSARLYQGGSDIGLTMVALGLARPAHSTDQAISVTAEAAQKRQIGMWGKK